MRVVQKVIVKRGWGGIFDPKFLLPWGHVKSNVQSIGDIINFRMYDTYFHHDVRGHSAGVTHPKSMRVNLFFFFSIFLQVFLAFSLFVSLFLFSFLLRIYLIFLFWPCLFTETSKAFEKRQSQSRFSEVNFSVFLGIESFWCPPSV